MINLRFTFCLSLTLLGFVEWNYVCGQEEEDALNEIKVDVIWKPEVCKRSVEKGDFVRYHYYGMLTNGDIFDSSFEKGSTYNTYVGNGWLIKGMDQGLIGMCVNEHRLITIPPQLAYGELGTDDIPSNASLIFNTILLDVWNDADKIKVVTTYLPEGCTRKLKTSDYVRYHYNGTLLNGKPFHSSYDDGQTYNTYVGQGWLIKGMDEGLIGVCIGERRRIVIPPHLAYGEAGDGKNIPRSATVIFRIEVADFHNPKDEVEIIITKAVDDCPRKLVDSDFVRYHYNGTLADGTVFDSSYSRNHTYDTYVGFKRLIPGMEIGLLGACMGEWRTITFPPHLGYGERGVEGKIPGSAVLTFHVHVIDFHNPKDKAEITVVSLPDECSQPDSRKTKDGNFVTFDYDMKLMDGTLLDSSKDRTGHFGTYIGTGNVIAGVDRGLYEMCVGEVRRIVVPPHLGYGEQGKEGMVPGSAVLDFEVEAVRIEEALPKGYQFMWTDASKLPDTEKEIFELMDEDSDGVVDLPEFTSFALDQVERGHARLLPGHPREDVVTDLFEYQDKNDDKLLTVDEFHLFAKPDPKSKEEL